MNTITKPTPLYWLISIVALEYGNIAYLGQAYISDDALKNVTRRKSTLFF